MLQAMLEGIAMFGPMVALMLTPVLIPLLVEIVGFATGRRKATRIPDSVALSAAKPTSDHASQLVDAA